MTTPEQKIKHLILLKAVEWGYEGITEPITSDNVDDLYDEADENDWIQDAKYELRCSGIETNLPVPHSRHYESEAVAAQLPDGSWVGWTYWYGGGKHGEPDAIDWIEDAYHVDCQEEEKVVVVQTFSRSG